MSPLHIHSPKAISDVGTLCGEYGSSVHIDARDDGAAQATCERCRTLEPSYRNGSPARERIRALEAALVEALDIAVKLGEDPPMYGTYERIAELRKLVEPKR
jgi:hypothetical protein